MSKIVSFITVAAVTMIGALSTTYAQTTAPAKAQTTAGTAAPGVISPEKQKLINRILELWPVENVGLIMLTKPLEESLRQSKSLLQGRVSAETQEATMKEINQDVANFLKDVQPVVLASAKKLIPTTVTPIFAEKFTEEELRQIIAFLESPVKSKFEAVTPEIQAALGQKIAADNGATINPKMTELTKQIGIRMRDAMNPK